MHNLYYYLSRAFSVIVGAIWCYVEPTVPFLAICMVAIAGDCYTAWRCNRRIAARAKAKGKKPPINYDGKLRSNKMFKMIGDLIEVMLCVVLAYYIDTRLLAHMGNLYLAQYVSAIYCVVQFVSILENVSTCNNAKWAKVLQNVVADKTQRHLGVDIASKTLTNEAVQTQRQKRT